MAMNKYMGFYELKNSGIPSVLWKEFTEDTVLDENLLWTVRVALERGEDFGLPRAVGVTAGDAYLAGRNMLDRYAGIGIVIYYPYFIAQKSGVMYIKKEMVIIEAVAGDLWNLVTDGRRDVTITTREEGIEFDGDRMFLELFEIEQLKKYGKVLSGKFRNIISEGSSIITEWSFAFNTDINRNPAGDRYLVFYELRSGE